MVLTTLTDAITAGGVVIGVAVLAVAGTMLTIKLLGVAVRYVRKFVG